MTTTASGAGHRRQCVSAFSFPLRLQPLSDVRPSLRVLCAPFHYRIGIKFFAVRPPHILNRMALAQSARCRKGIMHRRQQSCPFLLRVTIVEIVNLPVLRFAHLFSPLGDRTAIRSHLALHRQPQRDQPADGFGEVTKSDHCFSPGGLAPLGGAGGGVSAGVAATHSPAQILVALTVPTSLQPIGACGFACAGGLLATLGGGL
jgi:hypothetical protein